MQLSLREASQQAGTSKSTILRAIQTGRLSATRDDGGYRIDPAELCRVYPPDRRAWRSPTQHTPASEVVDVVEMRIRNATLEAQNTALRDVADELRADREELRRDREQLRADRDTWRSQAERLMLAAPLVTPPPMPAAPAPVPAAQRSWWKWWERQAG